MRHTKVDSPLRNFRRLRTINQQELARIVGVNQATISKAERGEIQLQPSLKARIAAVLAVSREELFPAPVEERDSVSA